MSENTDNTNNTENEELKCLKCGYTWTPRIISTSEKPDKPKCCPSCKRYGWDLEKRVRMDKDG